DPGGHHVDAVPRADVLTRPTQDAVVWIEHEVLGRLDALGEPPDVHRLDDVVGVDVDLGLGERHRAGSPIASSSITAARTLGRLTPKPSAPVLHDRGDHQDRDERSGGEPHRDGVPELEPPVASPGGTSPAELLLGEVHPERRDDDHRDQGEEREEQAEHHRRGPGPLELLEKALGALLERHKPFRNPHAAHPRVRPAADYSRGLLASPVTSIAPRACERLHKPSPTMPRTRPVCNPRLGAAGTYTRGSICRSWSRTSPASFSAGSRRGGLRGWRSSPAWSRSRRRASSRSCRATSRSWPVANLATSAVRSSPSCCSWGGSPWSSRRLERSPAARSRGSSSRRRGLASREP